MAGGVSPLGTRIGRTVVAQNRMNEKAREGEKERERKQKAGVMQNHVLYYRRSTTQTEVEFKEYLCTYKPTRTLFQASAGDKNLPGI